MATRNFVPRADGEGSIGTAAKAWGNGYFKSLQMPETGNANLAATLFDASQFAVQRNTAYAVGDIVYSRNLPSYLRLECVAAGTTGTTEPDYSSMSSGGGQ